jgi:hypothetical protein
MIPQQGFGFNWPTTLAVLLVALVGYAVNFAVAGRFLLLGGRQRLGVSIHFVCFALPFGLAIWQLGGAGLAALVRWRRYAGPGAREP